MYIIVSKCEELATLKHQKEKDEARRPHALCPSPTDDGLPVYSSATLSFSTLAVGLAQNMCESPIHLPRISGVQGSRDAGIAPIEGSRLHIRFLSERAYYPGILTNNIK
jgi:hypothetical protein